MDKTIRPAARVSGVVRLPGDKSISHRYAMLSSIAEGTSRLHNYSTGADCHSTLACMRALGVSMKVDGTDVEINGVGMSGLRAPQAELDAGNSGSTIRMLSGILAAQPFTTRIGGDESLSKRPMARIMGPLADMGASITATNGKYPPLEIHGGGLKPIDYTLPVPSAQVKSCILLAGLFAEGDTIVHEPVRTRDHTELALRGFGADIDTRPGLITLLGKARLQAQELLVPGDLSSAAFFLVAALITPGSELTIEGVGLNPTRAGLIDFLVSLGADIKIPQIEQMGGELIGTLVVRGAAIQGGTIEGATTAALIDEIPILSILGARSEEGLTVRDAGELRIKETDRIATLVENFRRIGVSIEEKPDGFRIPGRQEFRAATVDSFGDHRIAMAFAIASLVADGETTVKGSEAASVSFPEFYSTLDRISA